MKLKFTATYIASSGRGEVAVWMNGELFLVLPADYMPDMYDEDDEDRVIQTTVRLLGDRLQEMLNRSDNE